MATKKKKKRSIVGAPLTPEMLDKLGALKTLSTAYAAPSDQWTDTYRIWACHGYRESGNEHVGFLKIQRAPSKSESVFVLHVTQEINNDEGIVHVLDTSIQCQADSLATPIKWRMKSEFHDSKGKIVRDLGTEHIGRVHGNTIEIKTLGKTRRMPTSGPFTGEWCLLEAVQRMPYTEADSISMDVLKEMDLLLENHRIVYKGQDTVTIGGATMVLHHFQQWGRGMLPYDYWLDQHHRLQMFVTLSIAYIRDETAGQAKD
ncbi:hypothetical protein ACFL6U_23090 [Planctomycetota bacterium]